MNSLLYFMKQYYIAECIPDSFHANTVKELYYTAKYLGNIKDPEESLKHTLRFAEYYCHNVYLLGGVPFWFYYFFCILIDSTGVFAEKREMLLGMTPQQVEEYFDKIDEEIYSPRVKEDNK